MFYVGLDLGQSADSTALCLLEKHAGEQARYDVRYLQRYPLGTSYPDIVSDVAQRLQRPALHGTPLIVDGSGVGRAVVDLFRKQLRPVIPITITAGGQATLDEQGYWRVSKRDLIGNLQVLLQCERLRIAAELPEAATLVHELLNYEVKITAAAHDVYNARDGMHDDLVLALALAAWWAERPQPVRREPQALSFSGGWSGVWTPVDGRTR